MRRVGVIVTVGLLAAACTGGAAPEQAGEAAEEARGAEEEFQEQRETVEERLEALREARQQGRFGQAQRISGTPALGWAGEQVVNPQTDDWEPAIAADPNAPYVYILVTRYGEPRPCQGKCPVPHIALEVSSDGGATWSEGRPICPCKGAQGQFDPIIEVVPNTGHVYAVWMNDFNVVFSKSTDHGQSWSTPVPTWGNVSWNDKPTLGTSAGGRHVYISWNGPTGGDPWVAQSHDFGETWTQTKLVDGRRYFFAYDAAVLADGTVVFSESSLSYSGPAGSAEGPVRHHAFISRDGGQTWTNTVIDSVELGEPCVSEGCYDDFYAGQTGVSADSDGDLAYLYVGATTPGGKQRAWIRTSTDEGRSWSARTGLSPADEMATNPAVEATGSNGIRVWFAHTNDGDHDAWNVWYRRSTDGGATWSPRVKISDATSGADYKTPDGYLDVYGDYGEIAVTSAGKTIAVWGEGFSWIGPGGSWFNREV
jgi:hypothetical protein